jgi:cold shock CspA family protein
MGKSSETFSKKEKEKKRLKKQQDKKEKAAERKANSDEGKSLEDMMAYVDENGNITATAPDLSRRKSVRLEDITIGDTPRRGVVTFFNSSKGYGFIRDLKSQESIFVHVNGLMEQVQEKDKVTFETEQGQRGLNAIKVKKES